MLATIVPPQSLHRKSNSHGFIKYAVENLNGFVADFVPVNIFKQRFLEERGRRQLLVVACNNNCFSTVDSGNRVLRNNLRRFVKKNHVKLHQFRGEKLAYRHGTHEQAGFKPRKQVGDPLQKSANRHQLPLFHRLLKQGGYF